jgi:hypothetical protein
LRLSAEHWTECGLYSINPDYAQPLSKYCTDIYNKTKDSALKNCISYKELQNIENTCEEDRDSRSIDRNYLYGTFISMPDDIKTIIYYTQYIQLNGLQIDFTSWKTENKKSEDFISGSNTAIHKRLTKTGGPHFFAYLNRTSGIRYCCPVGATMRRPPAFADFTAIAGFL